MMSNAMENAHYLREALLATGKVKEGGSEARREIGREERRVRVEKMAPESLYV